METRAGEYGATISMHQVFGFFKISVKNAYSEASFKTAVVGPIGSAVPGILGATMLYNRLSVDRNQRPPGIEMTRDKPKRCLTISHNQARQR